MRKLAIVSMFVLAPVAAFAAGTVEDMDTDGNGSLSLTEIQAGYPSVTEESFTTLDTNADGAIDATELQAGVDAGTLVAAQ